MAALKTNEIVMMIVGLDALVIRYTENLKSFKKHAEEWPEEIKRARARIRECKRIQKILVGTDRLQAVPFKK